MAASASSSNTGSGAIATAISVVVLAAYCVALHLLIVDRSLPRTTLAFALAPWALALLSVCARNRRYWLVPIAAMVVALVVAIATGPGFWRFGDALAARVDHIVYLENLAFNMFLALVFAITLRPGREAPWKA